MNLYDCNILIVAEVAKSFGEIRKGDFREVLRVSIVAEVAETFGHVAVTTLGEFRYERLHCLEASDHLPATAVAQTHYRSLCRTFVKKLQPISQIAFLIVAAVTRHLGQRCPVSTVVVRT